jgi:hypothetical protein
MYRTRIMLRWQQSIPPSTLIMPRVTAPAAIALAAAKGLQQTHITHMQQMPKQHKLNSAYAATLPSTSCTQALEAVEATTPAKG